MIAVALFGFGHRTEFDFMHGGPQIRIGFALTARGGGDAGESLLADDEIATKNFRRIPPRGRCKGLCRDPVGSLDRQEVGLEHAPDVERRPSAPGRRPAAGLIVSAVPG